MRVSADRRYPPRSGIYAEKLLQSVKNRSYIVVQTVVLIDFHWMEQYNTFRVPPRPSTMDLWNSYVKWINMVVITPERGDLSEKGQKWENVEIAKSLIFLDYYFPQSLEGLAHRAVFRALKPLRI